jgi:hypothetical protein
VERVGIKKDYMSNKTLASVEQVGTKKDYMRNKTLAYVEQVGTKKMLYKEQDFSVHGTSRNKKGYMRNKNLACAEQVGTKIRETKFKKSRNKSYKNLGNKISKKSRNKSRLWSGSGRRRELKKLENKITKS